MVNLVRWEPFNDLVSLRDAMDRLFAESVVRPRGRFLAPFGEGGLALDIYDAEDAIVVKTAVPGVKPEDVEVTVTGDTLTIKGESKDEEEVKEENYIRRERRFGSFCRSIALPTNVVADEAEATFENGILKLTFPKAEEAKPKVIAVKPAKK
jgi:HSP20 family protein